MQALAIIAALVLSQAPMRVAYDGVEFVAENATRYTDGTAYFEWTPNNLRAYRAAVAARTAASKPAINPAPAPAPAPPKDKETVAFPAASSWTSPDQHAEPIGQMPNLTTDYGVPPSKLKRKGFTAQDARGKSYAEKVQRHAVETDASPLHLTAIGSPDECRPMMEDLDKNPDLMSLKPSFAIQEYRPQGRASWAVDSNLGFKPGNPEILIQQSDGTVLYRHDNYEGPEKLAQAMRAEVLRKANKQYNPDADPGQGMFRGSGCPLGFTREMWPAIFGVALFSLLALTWRKTPPNPEP